MQYNTKELLEDKEQLELTWHGEPTRVLVRGEAEKTEVETGGSITLSRAQAIELLKYSPLWTLAGDKPQKQPYMEALAKGQKAVDDENQKRRKTALAQLKAPKGTDKQKVNENFTPDMEEKDVVLTQLDIEAMKTKKQVIAELKKRGSGFNESSTLKELQAVLLEVEQERQAAKDAQEEKKPATPENAPEETEGETVSEAKDNEQSGPKMVKHTVTADDLELNPEWVEEGIKVGDEIEYPETEEGAAANSNETQA